MCNLEVTYESLLAVRATSEDLDVVNINEVMEDEEDEDIRIIDYGAFADNDMTRVFIPDTVISIRDEAFIGCLNLEEVMLPDSLLRIGERAFCDCENMKNVMLSKRLMVIEDEAFQNCSSVQFIDTYKHLETIGAHAFSGMSALEAVVLNEGLESIDDGAFELCPRLETIKLPHSLKYLGYAVFQGNTSLVAFDYNGNIADFNAIEKDADWLSNSSIKTIHCLDGNIEI